eukprot:3280333-Pyramimonas_sp.AAC.1
MSVDPLAWTPAVRTTLLDDIGLVGPKLGKDGLSAEISGLWTVDHVDKDGASMSTSVNVEKNMGGGISPKEVGMYKERVDGPTKSTSPRIRGTKATMLQKFNSPERPLPPA